MSLHHHTWPWLSVLLSLSVLGCSRPTYRGEQITQTIERLCADEYQLDVTVKRTGETVAVYLHHPGILQQTGQHIGLAPSANEVLGNLIEVIHRVVFSADAPTNFYILLVSDPTAPGAYLTLVRYLDDVRRVQANIIPPTEFFSRMILDLKYLPAPPELMKQLVLNDLTLEQFLSHQLAQRIHARLVERLSAQDASTVEVRKCVGEFRDGEFAFTLNVEPQGDAPFDQELVQQLFEDAVEVIAQVLSGYRFDQFQTIRLIHPATGRSLLLPKTQLELFR